MNQGKYIDCFVTYEERTRTITDSEGNEYEEIYMTAIPITNLSEIYKNIESEMGGR